MTDWKWRARVETKSGLALGAGFLVDANHVVTCAHVVDGMASARVAFPGTFEERPAVVTRCTDWVKSGDLGDVAVLKLDTPVAITPATFAPLNALRTIRNVELGAYGFPRNKEESGSVVELRTRPDMDLRQEWWQLNVPAAHLETLEHGFSGSAVYVAATGEVVGMVTDRDSMVEGTSGRMLPISRLREYWEDLDDLLDLGWLTPEQRRELRRLVRGTAPTLPVDTIHHQIFPTVRNVRPLRSVWDAISYVAEENVEADALGSFLRKLSLYLDEPARGRLAGWAHRNLAAPDPPPAAMPTSLIIRLDRMTRGGIYELTLLTLVDGETGPSTEPVEVREGEIRERVEAALPNVRDAVLNREWIIEFALPVSLFNEPFETWSIANGIMMWVYPVVLRDVQRMSPSSIPRDLTMRRWVLLRKRGKTSPKSIGCTVTHADMVFQNWLHAHDEYGALTYAASPSKGRLNAALNAGIPVMLWPRGSCGDDAHDSCAGARRLKELTAAFADVNPDELPEKVMRLRMQAWDPDASEGHLGRDLALVWDDPARLPDPPLAMGI
jgi:hypothetical protein